MKSFLVVADASLPYPAGVKISMRFGLKKQ